MFEQLMQNNWFVLLVALVFPLVVGILMLVFFAKRRKRVIRLREELIFPPNGTVASFSMFMIVALASGGTYWILHQRYLSGIGALLTAMELVRWYPASVRFSPMGVTWWTPFARDEMNWEEISCARKRVMFAKKLDDSFEIFGSRGQRLIIQQSAHPAAPQMLAAISEELKKRKLVTFGTPPQESMLEWVHRAFGIIGLALLLLGRFGARH